MNVLLLGFAQVTLLSPDVVELVFDEGVTVNDMMIDELLGVIETHAVRPTLILFDKRNKYSYEFGVQRRIAKFRDVAGVAIVNYNAMGRIITSTILATFFSEPRWPIATFSNRAQALAWLQQLPARASEFSGRPIEVECLPT